MLTHYDYIVIGFYFLFMSGIGWAFRKFIATSGDYFRSGGEMLWWICGAGVFMTQFSAWTFTGAASKAYTDGFFVMAIFFGNAVGFLFNALCFGPWFRQMRTITAMQTVRERFGQFTEQFYLWVGFPLHITGSSIGLYGLGVFLSAVFGFPVALTISVIGVVVITLSVVGGSWAVIASDFIQALILMPVTIVAAVLALAHVGGASAFAGKLPARFVDLSQWMTPTIAYVWIGAMFLKQFITNNNMLDAYRYLNVKDGRHARWAALFAAALMFIGPIVWFIPPMAAAIAIPDLRQGHGNLTNPNDAAYFAMCQLVFPVGMMGLLISAIFAATLSSMDSGLNRNAGFLVKNFYQPVIRPGAHDRELLVAGKILSVVLGLVIISTAIYWSKLKNLPLFDLMQKYSALFSVPMSIPLVWGMLLRRVPQWASVAAAILTLAASMVVNQFLLRPFTNLLFGDISAAEMSDWTVAVGLIVNVIVGSAVFLGCAALARYRSREEVERVDRFFARMRTPIDFAREEGKASDGMQLRTLGWLCEIYGGFLLLLILIPNPLTGRIAFLFCGGCMFGIGWLLARAGKRHALRAQDFDATSQFRAARDGSKAVTITP